MSGKEILEELQVSADAVLRDAQKLSEEIKNVKDDISKEEADRFKDGFLQLRNRIGEAEQKLDDVAKQKSAGENFFQKTSEFFSGPSVKEAAENVKKTLNKASVIVSKGLDQAKRLGKNAIAIAKIEASVSKSRMEYEKRVGGTLDKNEKAAFDAIKQARISVFKEPRSLAEMEKARQNVDQVISDIKISDILRGKGSAYHEHGDLIDSLQAYKNGLDKFKAHELYNIKNASELSPEDRAEYYLLKSEEAVNEAERIMHKPMSPDNAYKLFEISEDMELFKGEMNEMEMHADISESTRDRLDLQIKNLIVQANMYRVLSEEYAHDEPNLTDSSISRQQLAADIYIRYSEGIEVAAPAATAEALMSRIQEEGLKAAKAGEKLKPMLEKAGVEPDRLLEAENEAAKISMSAKEKAVSMEIAEDMFGSPEGFSNVHDTLLRISETSEDLANTIHMAVSFQQTEHPTPEMEAAYDEIKKFSVSASAPAADTRQMPGLEFSEKTQADIGQEH